MKNTISRAVQGIVALTLVCITALIAVYPSSSFGQSLGLLKDSSYSSTFSGRFFVSSEGTLGYKYLSVEQKDSTVELSLSLESVIPTREILYSGTVSLSVLPGEVSDYWSSDFVVHQGKLFLLTFSSEGYFTSVPRFVVIDIADNGVILDTVFSARFLRTTWYYFHTNLQDKLFVGSDAVYWSFLDDYFNPDHGYLVAFPFDGSPLTVQEMPAGLGRPFAVFKDKLIFVTPQQEGTGFHLNNKDYFVSSTSVSPSSIAIHWKEQFFFSHALSISQTAERLVLYAGISKGIYGIAPKIFTFSEYGPLDSIIPPGVQTINPGAGGPQVPFSYLQDSRSFVVKDVQVQEEDEQFSILSLQTATTDGQPIMEWEVPRLYRYIQGINAVFELFDGSIVVLAMVSDTGGVSSTSKLFHIGRSPLVPTLAATVENRVAHISWDVPKHGGSPITSYGLSYRIVGSEEDWTILTDISADAASQSIAGLLDGAYEVRIAANNDIGSGDWSVPAQFSIGSTGVRDIAATLKIRAYPNPASAGTQVRLDAAGSVQVFDTRGSLIFSGSADAFMAPTYPGIYIVRVTGTDSRTGVTKLVVTE